MSTWVKRPLVFVAHRGSAARFDFHPPRFRGDGSAQEFIEPGRDLIRLLDLGQVPAIRKKNEPAVGQAGHRGLSMMGRHDPVLFAPEYQGRLREPVLPGCAGAPPPVGVAILLPQARSV
jgi:hypothetical protein